MTALDGRSVDSPAPLSIRAFGALGDGTTDDTAALQAALDWATANSRRLYVPAGDFLHSEPLTIGYSKGWRIEGEGRRVARFIQATDNTPVFDLPESGTAWWDVSGIGLSWVNTQDGNTSAVGFRFGNGGDQPDGYGHYGFRIHDVSFERGYLGVGQADTAVENPIWSCELDDLHFDESWRGPAIRLRNTAGQPNNVVSRIYVVATNIPVDPIIEFQGCRNLRAHSLEVNRSNRPVELFFDTCTGVMLDGYRSEFGTITGTFKGLVTFAATDATVRGVEVYNKTVNVGAGAYAYAIRHSAGAGRVSLDGLRINTITATSGALHGVQVGGSGIIDLGWVEYAGTVVYPYDATPSKVIRRTGTSIELGSVVLRSPNGTRYTVTVGDDGSLSAATA